MSNSDERKTMSKVQESYGIRQLESRLHPNGKSVIEEWRNTTNRYDGILPNDECYEERGIDVGNDPTFTSITRGCCARERSMKPKNSINQAGKTSSVKIVKAVNNDDFTERENVEKTVRNQSTGTVRSIPIKDYRASLAHDMGTLRRSVMPQQQFETFLSEPERNSRERIKRRGGIRSSATTTSSVKNRFFHVSPIPPKRNGTVVTNSSRQLYESQDRSKSRRSLKSNRDRMNNDTMECLPNFRFLDDGQEFLVNTNVHSSRGSSNRWERTNDPRCDVIPCFVQDNGRNCRKSERHLLNEEDDHERSQSIDLERGNVVKKISVYEGNVRSSVRSEQTPLRHDLQGSVVAKRHRTIGVPLVGMHNACGLPVIAPWPESRFIGTLRVPGRLIDDIRRAGENTTFEPRIGNHTKRKAPQPMEIRNSRVNHEASRTIDREIGVNEPNDESTESTTRKRILKRPSFKADRINTMPYKQRYSRRNTVGKIGNKDVRASGTSGSVGKRSFARRNSKRSTLYAKDEGNEAAEVLTSLCLNPLARNKGGANMIW